MNPKTTIQTRNRLLLWCLLGALGGAQLTSADTVAYYRFENGANGYSAIGTNTILDSSGNGLNGSPIGGVVYSSNVPENPIAQTGAPNLLSLDFNGSSGRIFIPDYPLLELTNSLTIEAFIYAASSAGGPFNTAQIFFRGDDRGGWDPYFFCLSGNNLNFSITDTNDNIASVQAPITLHSWHHVAGTLNGTTGEQSLYIDGVLVAQATTSERPFGPLTGANPGLGIGNVESPNYAEYFNGLIDEVRISDTALAPNQFLNAPTNVSVPVVNINKAVWLSFSNLTVGINYQVQVSTSLSGTFTNYGSPFSATNSSMPYPAYWNVDN